MIRRKPFATVGLSFYAVSTLIGMAPMSIGAAILGAALLAGPGGPIGVLNALKAQSREKWVRIYWNLSLTYFLICVLSLVGTVMAPVGYHGELLHVDWLPDAGKLWYLLWPPILLVAIRRAGPAGLARVYQAWVLTFLALSAIGIFQHYWGWPRTMPIPYIVGATRYHVTGFLGHHLSVSSIWIFPFFAALDALRRPALRRDWRLRLGVVIATVGIGSFALFFTHSKMLWFSVPVGVAFWLFITLPRKFKLVAVAVVALGMAFGATRDTVRIRFADPFSYESRGRLWEMNWEFFKSRPLLGVGWRKEHELSWMYLQEKFPNQDQFGGHAHDNALQALSSTGVVGLAAWLAWCVLFVVLLFPLRDRPGEFRRALLAAWIVFQINGITQVNFWEGKVTHEVMLMMALALAWRTARE